MRALCLSGGASRGAFQVGVLKKWMGEQKRDYEIMIGVSVGALNVAGLAMTPIGDPSMSIARLEQFWLDKVTGTSAIYKRWFPFGRLHSLWEKSVYDSSPLMKLVRENLHLSEVRAAGRKLAIGCVCLDTGEHFFATEQEENFSDWVLASSSFPVFMTPIDIDGKLWSDGGIFNITPLGQAIKMGATEIDVIICSDPWEADTWDSTDKAAVPDHVIRMLGLMSDQIARNDIELTGLKNELADLSAKYSHVTIRTVVPTKPLNVDSLEFKPEDTRRLIQMGYDDADNLVTYG